MVKDNHLLLLVAVAFVAFISVQMSLRMSGAAPSAPAASQPMIVMQSPMAMQTRGDDRYTRAPEPQRFWDNGPFGPERPEIPVRGSIMDPIATRGSPEAYQQMGVILGSDGKPLPLYGRRVAPRSDRFNYYTRTDSYNPVALPVRFKKRDCQDNLGCDEIFSGDDIKISATGDTAKVTLYGFDGPKYVP